MAAARTLNLENLINTEFMPFSAYSNESEPVCETWNYKNIDK